MKCRVCDQGGLYWNSHCKKCGYYQHSCISPTMFKFLKVKENVIGLYSKILDK